MRTHINYLIILMLTFMVLYGTGLAAQEVGMVIENEPVPYRGGLYFFSALVSGVVLALALSLVFTIAAAAVGITIVSPEDKIRPGASSGGTHESGRSHPASTIKKVNHLFGFWTLLATSLCLLAACWLAIEISGAMTVMSAIVMALTVWAAFYLILMGLETTLVTTVTGSLFATASSVLQSSVKGLKAVFEKSPQSKAADTAAEITEAVRGELFKDVNTSKLKKQIQHYIQQLSPPSARDIKSELASLFDETEIEAVIDETRTPGLNVEHVIAQFQEHSRNKERARSLGRQVKEAIHSFRQQREHGKDTFAAGIDSAMQMTGQTPEEAQQQREKIEAYLRNSNKEELQPEELKRRVRTLFQHPKEGAAQIGESIRAIDHDTAVTLLEQRNDIDHQEAEKIATNFEQAMQTIFSMTGTGKSKMSDQVSGAKDRVETKLRNYLNSIDEPEFDYEGIKEDVTLLFHDPKAGADALISRLKSLDRESLKSIIASRRDISEERAGKIVSKLEQTRDEAIRKAEMMKQKVEEKIAQTQEATANMLEQSRENVAIASWWAFGTAVVSGAAAALGGFLAVTT